MSAVADDVIVADKPILTLQRKHDDIGMSGKLTAGGEVLDGATSGVEEVVVGARDVPGATHKDDDSWITATSDDTLAAETSAEILNVSKVVDDTEPETPLQHTSDPDNENTIIIQDSEPPPNVKIYSPPVEVSEQPTTFTMSPNKTSVTLGELTEEDANEVADTAISEITKDELPAINGTEAQTPPVDANTTIADGPKASVKDGEPPIGGSVGPESAISDNVKPSINGVGSTTGTEPSLETPTRDPHVQMNRSVEMLEEVATPPVEVQEMQEIPPTIVEPVEDISELSEEDAEQMEVSPTDERPVITVPASEDTPIPVEAELACIETQASPDEPETMSIGLEAVPIDSTASVELLEETITEPEPEPILQEEAESDSAKELAPVAEAITAAAEPDSTSDAEPEEPAAEFVALVAAEETAIEEPKVAIETVDQPAPPIELEVDASVPVVVSAPAEVVTKPVVAPTQLEETITIAIMEPEDPAETAATAEVGRIAANDSIAAEPAHVAVSNPEPVATTETDPVAIAEPDSAAVVPESLAIVEPEHTKPGVENTVGETVPIDVEPPSSNASFIEDPEVGFAYTDEEPHASVTEETVAPVFDEPALESAEEESKPQEIVDFEEPPIDETVAVEEVVPVDLAATTREPASSDETALVEESPLGGTVQVEEVVTAPTVEPAAVADAAVSGVTPVEDVAPIENVTSVEEITPSEGVTSIDSPTVEVVATSVEEDIPVAEEPSAPASAEEDTPAIEEPPAPALVEDISVVEELSMPATVEEVSAIEDISIVEELSVPATVEEVSAIEEHVPVIEKLPVATPVEDVVPDVEESVPASVDEDVPDVEELLVTTSVKEISTIEEPPVPASVEENVPVAEELPVPPPVEGVIVVEEPPAPVEEDAPTAEEPLALTGVEEPEAVTIEDAPTPEEEHEPVAADETLVQPVAIEETPAIVEEYRVADDQKDDIPIAEATPAIGEPALEATSTTEEPPAPEEGPAIALYEPSEVEVLPMPAAASVTTADSTLTASSVEETVIVAEELIECDAPIAEQSVLIEEPTPAESEASVFEEIVTEELHATGELHATVEPTEEPLIASEETKDELEASLRAEAPASLTEQLADEPTTEESLEVPIAKFWAETTAEPAVLEQEELVITSQVQIDEEPDADAIYVNESIKDSEPSSALAETSSEIEEVAEQQALATIIALSVATDIERPKSPWTPSYSVTTQGSGVAVEEPASNYEEDDTVPTHAQTPEIIVDEAAVIVPEIAADVAAAIQSQGDTNVAVQSAEEQVALDEAEEAHPKSPWASSYSVTVQGNVTQTQGGPTDLEQLPPSAAQSVEAEEVEEQSVPFTQEALVTGEVSSSTEIAVDAHAVLLETLEHTVPNPAVEAEVPQHVRSEQVTPAVEEESLALIMPEPATVEEEPEEEIDLGSFIVEDESVQLSAEPTGERSRSWTPSYSVTGLEPAFASEKQAVTDEDEFVEQGSFIIEDRPATIVESTPEAKSELLTPVDDPVGERPKSPWTPSYSVTKQGQSEETEELDELEQLPSPVAGAPALAADEEPVHSVLITETRASVDEYVTADEAPIVQETFQTFPKLEGSQKISQKPSLSAVDELSAANAIDVTESTTLRIDIPATNEDSRKRLESTTSSRFFPGGWFSSSPKVPEEGRASLDVAAGEFIHQTSVENTPTTDLPSAVEEDREKKSRWCTIM